MDPLAAQTEKTLSDIKESQGLPFNYRFLKVLYSLESIEKDEIEIVKIAPIRAYQSTAFQMSRHHKPISKIVDPSVLK